MARMPQIPQTEFSSRPGGGVGSALPDSKDVTAPLDSASGAIANVGDHLEALQRTRDTAEKDLKKHYDSVKATQLAGDHEEKLSNLHDSLTEQFWDAPEKLPEEFRKQSNELTASELSAQPDQGIRGDMAAKYAEIDNHALTKAHGWMVHRQAGLVKDGVTKIAAGSIRAAQAQTSVAGLAAAMDKAEENLTDGLKGLHADPLARKEALDGIRQKMASAWVEANGPDNPAGVALALDAAAKKGGGPLAELKPEHLEHYQKQAQTWLKGYGERERFQVSKEAIALNNKLGTLFHDGQLDSKNAFQLKDSLEAKIKSIEANPQYKNNPEERAAQTKIVQMQLDGLKYLREAAEKPGHFDPVFDSSKVNDILDRFDVLGKPGAKGPKDLLKIVKLQSDLAKAQADRWIPPGYASTMTKSLAQMTGKGIAGEAKNTGWGISFLGFGGRSPQQAGNVVLNNYFKGDNKAFGKLTLEQQNQARIDYMGQLVDAQENGRNMDTRAAEEMAFAAIKNVAGRQGSGRR